MGALNPRYRTTLAGQITIALYRVAQAFDHLMRQRGKALRLSPAQIQSLLFLKFARPGVHTVGGLAQRLDVTYATASGVADALERKRLIRRKPLPTDRRIITLDLTPDGRRQTELLEDMLDEIEAAVNSLPTAEQSAVRHAIQRVVQALQRAGYIHIYDMCWGCQFFRKDAHPSDPRGPHHCAFMDAPLAEPDTYLECPDFVAVDISEERW